ncbi:hypothetical protein [Sediminibacillus massiliensis]|uniref:hypothetical protein n=1 Tax=Sediminibacillus massiliensis TaxID=1926277 RepID=UPI00098864E0|nr:hypothetical protein [Sediminibacillus massiliensis]
MKYVMEALKQREAQEKIPGIRMEIDYELVTLHDALQENDQQEIERTKHRLNELREQLYELS